MKRAKKQEISEEKTKQLDLGIKEPFKNKVFKVKGKANVMLLQFEVRKFFKDPFYWFVGVFSVAMLLQQGLWLYNNINKFPTLTPILNYNLAPENRLVDKHFLYIFPVISLISIIVSIIITIKYYNKEKMLTTFALLCTLLACISGTIMLIHLTIDY